MRRRRAAMAVACSILLAAGLAAAGEVSVTFYHTSDIHEHAGPLARIAGFVQAQREAGRNVVFVDSGDWCNKGDLTDLGTRGDAVTELMGAMAYDAVIPGNHDYSHGTRRLAELIDKHRLPALAANCTWPADATPKNVQPYKLFAFEGVKIAVIGTATPIMGNATDQLLKVQPIAAAVKPLVVKLGREADIVVLLTHLGPPEDRKLIAALPRLDLVLGGHHHKRFTKLNFDPQRQTILQHSGCFGAHIGEVVITWDGAKIVGRAARLLKVAPAMPASPKVAAIRARYQPAKAK